MEQSFVEVLTPESAQHAGELLSYWIQKFLADPSTPVSVTSEMTQLHKDGSIIHTEVTATVAMNKMGKLEIIGVSRDITERQASGIPWCQGRNLGGVCRTNAKNR